MRITTFLLSTLLLLGSCKKAKELLDVTFRFSTKNDITLPKLSDTEHAVVDSILTITTPEITNTIPDEFKKNNADINKVKELTIEGLDLTIKSPTGQTFGFMKTIEIYIGATGKGEQLIATRTDIQNITPAPTVLSLAPENANIIDYIKGPTYYLKVKAGISKTYTADINIGSEIKFKAVANPLN